MKTILHFASSFPKDDNDLAGVFVKKLAAYAAESTRCFVLAPAHVETHGCEKAGNMRIERFSYFIKKYQRLTYQDSILQNLRRSKLLYLLVPSFLLCAAIHLKKLVKTHCIGLVHAHWIFPQGFLAVMARELAHLQCKILVTSHGSDIFVLDSALFRRLHKFTLKRADAVTAVSSSIKEKMDKDFSIGAKVRVIPMGTDASLFSRKTVRPMPGPYLLYVGRLDEKKGLSFLIEAFSHVLRRGNKLKLVMIGSGYFKDGVARLVQQHRLAQNVILLDQMPQRELPPYYRHAEILIGPSLSEGFGLVYVEAMLSRCPVIATSVGGTVDIIRHRETGLLVEPGNAMQIAEAVQLLLRDRTLRRKLVHNGFECAKENFTWDAIGKKYTDLYKELFSK